MVSEIEKLLGRIYQTFFLRDILGFVLPGSLSLLSILFVAHSNSLLPVASLITKLCQTLIQGDTVASCEVFALNWGIIIFLGVAYLWAWILQSVYYVLLVNWLVPLNRIFPSKELLKLMSKELKDLEILVQDLPTVTRGALQPDLVRANSMPNDTIEKHLIEMPYSERASALMLMSANLGSGFLLLAVIIVVKSLIVGDAQLGLNIGMAIILGLVAWCLYREHWRIWNVRNLQVAIYGAGLRKERSSVTNPKGDGTPQSGVAQK